MKVNVKVIWKLKWYDVNKTNEVRKTSTLNVVQQILINSLLY
jgi:hypothetical protein